MRLVCDELRDVAWLMFVLWLLLVCVLVYVCLMGALFAVDCVMVYGVSSVCLRVCGGVCVYACLWIA